MIGWRSLRVLGAKSAATIGVAVLLFALCPKPLVAADSPTGTPNGLTGMDYRCVTAEDCPNYVPNTSDCTDSGDSVDAADLTGNGPEQKIFNYYVGKGLSAMDAAAIDGNYGQESHWNSNDSGGYLAQWGGGRLTNLQNFAQQQGLPVTDLGVQLDFSWQELTGPYSAVLQNVKAATTIEDATQQFMGPNPAPIPGYPDAVGGGYEDPGIPQLQNRITYAKSALQLYGGGAANSGSTADVPDSDGGCSGASAINCPTGASSGAASADVRQQVVCIAQGELALWKSQSDYGAAYPNFAYAQTGYLKYTQGSPEEWCADFVSWVYDQAGDPLQADPNWRISTVEALEAAAQQSTKFIWHPESSNYTPQPGDIAIHLDDGVSHTNIFISSSGGTAQYIGGDQGSGPYPGGSVVSIEYGSGYYDNGISGYISPN